MRLSPIPSPQSLRSYFLFFIVVSAFVDGRAIIRRSLIKRHKTDQIDDPSQVPPNGSIQSSYQQPQGYRPSTDDEIYHVGNSQASPTFNHDGSPEHRSSQSSSEHGNAVFSLGDSSVNNEHLAFLVSQTDLTGSLGTFISSPASTIEKNELPYDPSGQSRKRNGGKAQSLTTHHNKDANYDNDEMIHRSPHPGGTREASRSVSWSPHDRYFKYQIPNRNWSTPPGPTEEDWEREWETPEIFEKLDSSWKNTLIGQPLSLEEKDPFACSRPKLRIKIPPAKEYYSQESKTSTEAYSPSSSMWDSSSMSGYSTPEILRNPIEPITPESESIPVHEQNHYFDSPPSPGGLERNSGLELHRTASDGAYFEPKASMLLDKSPGQV